MFKPNPRAIRCLGITILLAGVILITGCQHPDAKSARSALRGHDTAFFPDSTTALEYNAYRAFELCLDVIAQNIANANTTGFKRCRVEFQELTGPSAGLSEPASVDRMPLRRGSQVVGVRRIFTNGNTVGTGEPLDIAIIGDGFFEVQLPDGTKAYTRDGSFRTASDRRATTSDGLPLQGGFQPIPSDTTSIIISSSGEVVWVSASGTRSFRVQLCRFPSPSGLMAIQGNLYKETAASGSPEIGHPGENGFGNLAQGFLECSNVNISEEMFELARVRNACKALVEVAKARGWSK